MKCPTCSDAVLVMADRSGIEIDYCPSCRGVWLDRGELEKIIAGAKEERVAFEQDRSQFYQDPDAYRRSHPQRPQSNSKYHSKYHDPRGGQYPRKKKSSFLGEIFDF